MTVHLQDSRPASGKVPLLRCEEVTREFPVSQQRSWRKAKVSAVSRVSFEIAAGETFAVVGETGSGKSTLARAIVGAPPPQSGRIQLNGTDLPKRRRASGGSPIQMIFQDPFSALDPRWTIERLVDEPLRVRGVHDERLRRSRVAWILERVGLPASRYGDRFARDLSGGQAQRVAIARALVCSPSLVICDEPVTSLDVSIQAQILKLLDDLRDELSLTYLVIAHDLAMVRLLADRTATMYLGTFCEIGPTKDMFDRPAHPYTAALLSAIPPRPGQPETNERIRLRGEPPSPIDPPSGCRFHTRCQFAEDRCAHEAPPTHSLGDGHTVACHFPLVTPAAATPDGATTAPATTDA